MTDLDDVVARVRASQSLPPPLMRRAIRKRAGLSQQDIAGILGVSRVAVARWELGERQPDKTNVVKYAEVLNTLDAESR